MASAPASHETFARALNLPDFRELASRLEQGVGSQVVHGLHGSAKAMFAVELARRLRRPLLVVVATSRDLESAEEALRFFAPHLELAAADDVVALPGFDVDPLQGISPHPEVMARRMRAFSRLAAGAVPVVITTSLGLAAGTPPPDSIRGRQLVVTEGERMTRDDLLRSLASLGYRKEWRVEVAGELALRGGIVDVFPAGMSEPVRLELEGDWVASLRTFAPGTQRSLDTLSEVVLAAVRETTLDDEARTRLATALRARASAMELSGEGERLVALLQARGSFPGMELWSTVVAGGRTSVPELVAALFGTWPLVVWDEAEGGRAAYEESRRELASRLEVATVLVPELELVLPPLAELERELDLGGARVMLEELGRPDPDSGGLVLGARPAPAFGARLGDLCRDLAARKARGDVVVLFLSSEGTRKRVAEVLEDYGVTTAPGNGEVLLELGALAGGFELPEAGFALLSEEEIFGSVLSRGKRGARVTAPSRPRREGFAALTDFHDLTVGDHVVHVENGVGVYQGLVSLGAGAEAREFMLLVYHAGDKLYVPLDRLDLVQRHQGAEGAAPRLDKLGGATWERTKRRVRKAVREIGTELLKLYARRATAQGHAFAADTPWQAEFEDSFPFEETPDQAVAIADVKKDMEAARPMDRLLCGDVGYGKTEVAMRAAFKACSDGKQVAVLAPTTVLAFQHFRTFSARFLPFPVRIGMLSRFVPATAQRQTLKELAEGRLDLVIGTHRVLSKDVAFHDLGLVIIDEEQRFGVAQKEKLKDLRARVDVLTMTATPIPRTLQMALAGIRELSVIETPPKNRLSIQTTVRAYGAELVTFALRRELSRGGQVYFVHDRVDSIYTMASTIGSLVPEARVVVAHGQMAEREVEKVMMTFVEGRADVLVATTIIENGLDIPAANTLIVNRADRFGLSQLYQLRGRVGRADRRAYAFLLVPSTTELTEVAKKRLAAIEEFSELGAGFRVAALDLQIRGGGNVLGAEQHGHIESVGFDLYLKLLDEAVRELRGDEVRPDIRTTLNLKVDIRIPPEFLPDVAERMTLYKRIAHAADDATVDAIAAEVRDLYGRLPVQVERLLELTRVRNLANALRIESVERVADGIAVRFHESTPLAPRRLVEFLAARPGAQLREQGTVEIPLAQTEREDPVETTRNLLQSLLA